MRRQVASLAVLLAMVACCGGVADRAHRTLGVALNATNAARDSFLSWDKQHQLHIVEHADSREEAEARLRVYRHQRNDVMRAFTVAYTTIAAAAASLPLVEDGTRSEVDLVKLIADAATATAAVKAVIKAVREGTD